MENTLKMKGDIFISKHSVEGLGGFSEKTELEFNSNVTVLLGVNGSGKTTLLNSVYGSIVPIISHFLRTDFKKVGLSSIAISIGKANASVSSRFNLKKVDTCAMIEYSLHLNERYNNPYIEPIVKEYINNQYIDSENGELPLFRYFQTEKIIKNSKGVLLAQKFNKIERRTSGYNRHYEKAMQTEEFTGFVIDQINIENAEKVERKELGFETKTGKYFRNTLNTFTSILYGKSVRIRAGGSKFAQGQSLIINKDGNDFEFLQLSSGEKYIFSLVLELIYRSVTLNPNSKDLTQISGIVLIDEIEDHLHPRWQLTILDALQKCFPKVQFIVSTHSPLIASSVRREQIIAINNFEIIPSEELPDIYSGSADELLNKILFSSEKIEKFQKKKRAIDVLINRMEFDEAEKELELLKKEVNSSPKWLKNLETKISFAKA